MSLAIGSWWAVVVASVVQAAGAFAVISILATAAEQTERVDPRASPPLVLPAAAAWLVLKERMDGPT